MERENRLVPIIHRELSERLGISQAVVSKLIRIGEKEVVEKSIKLLS